MVDEALVVLIDYGRFWLCLVVFGCVLVAYGLGLVGVGRSWSLSVVSRSWLMVSGRFAPVNSLWLTSHHNDNLSSVVW